MVANGHHSIAQVWKDLDGGFGCPDCGALGYEIAIDETNNRLLLSGTLFCGNDCEDWRMPAAWDGLVWSKKGEAATHINFLTIGTYKDEIYSNNSIQGHDGSCFIKWNGMEWDTIAGGPPTISLYCMEEHEDYLYVAGAFQLCAGDTASLIFRYDGETVEPLVDYFGQTAYGQALEFYHDTLFVGGRFFNDEDQVFNLGSVYDSNVHRVGHGLLHNCNVEALEVHDGVLWIGGYFGPGNFDPEKHFHLAYYDGHSLRPSPWQPDGRVTALKSYNNELYMAGWFAHIEDLESHGVAKINDFGYYSLNPDTLYNHYGAAASYSPGIVRDMEIWSDTLYIAGSFGAIGTDTTLNSIAKLNRSLSAFSSFAPLGIEVYPNPVQGVVTLTTDTYFSQPVSIAITDCVGREILRDIWPAGERTCSIALNDLASGAYLITLSGSHGKIIKRILKE
jgi:hypothetical protein